MDNPHILPPPNDTPSNRDLARALTRIKDGEGENELVFDPASGTLRVVRSGEEAGGAQLATKMAEEGFFAGPGEAPPSNAVVAAALRTLKRDDSGAELRFDPVSGTLRVARPGDEGPAPAGNDDLPATEMAREGFFAAQAVVHEEELQAWRDSGVARSAGLVFERDEDVFHHALVSPADWRRAGRAAESLVARGNVESAPLELLPAGSTARHLLVVLDDGKARSWTRGVDGWSQDALQCVPAPAVFSRNEGILESRLLLDKKVAVVGLGSGGAGIVNELVKAGVGAFLLADKDRLEVHNVGRHACDLRDLGRLKTRAMKDQVLARNPHARVELLEGDIRSDADAFAEAVEECDVLVAATDNNASRRLVNRVAVELARPAIFGRAFTRACGGDVIRYRPGGPCYECLVGRGEKAAALPSAGQKTAYSDRPVTAVPGLSLDIAPVSQMCARLVVQELVRGTGSGLEVLNAELDAPVYVWANRREAQFQEWSPMGASVGGLTVMRWYGSRADRRPGCPSCDAGAWMAASREEAARVRK